MDLDLSDVIKLYTDSELRVRLQVRKDFLDFLISAARTDAADDASYYEIDTEAVELIQRPIAPTTEFASATASNLRVVMTSIGDDPPCGGRWQ